MSTTTHGVPAAPATQDGPRQTTGARSSRQNGGRFIDRPRVTCLTRAYASSVARRVVPCVQTTSRSVFVFVRVDSRTTVAPMARQPCCFRLERAAVRV
jgi:hypothetical protein